MGTHGNLSASYKNKEVLTKIHLYYSFLFVLVFLFKKNIEKKKKKSLRKVQARLCPFILLNFTQLITIFFLYTC